MIQVRHSIAWVCDNDGCLMPFDVDRLVTSIQSAITLAGHDESWLAEPIAKAIHLYVREGADRQTIPLATLAEIVKAILDMLGHGDISRAYGARRQRTEIRLDRVARSSAPSLELDFYRQLDEALGIVSDEKVVSLRVCELRSCVMRLRGARRWSNGCRQLADEIVRHVRARACQLRPARATTLDLALLE